MKLVKLSLVIFLCIGFLAGCSSKEPNQPVDKVQEKAPNKPAEQKDVTNKALATPAPASAPVDDVKWILVLKVNDKVNDKSKEKILTTVKTKWFKDKAVKMIDAKNYKMEQCLGKFVVFAEVMYQYGEYDFTVRTGKIIEEEGDAIEEPVAKEKGPDGRIRGQSTLEALLKEIRFL